MTSIDPDLLLSDPALDAAVVALANRNAHHVEGMTDEERSEAAAHWRNLAMDVLVAARATISDPDLAGMPRADVAPGRAVIVFEDAGPEEINMRVSFHPELQDMGNDTVAGTPAQLTAVTLLDSLNAPQDGAGEGA